MNTNITMKASDGLRQHDAHVTASTHMDPFHANFFTATLTQISVFKPQLRRRVVGRDALAVDHEEGSHCAAGL